MKEKPFKLLKALFIVSLTLLFLVACAPSEASEVLEDRIFDKHIGDGPDGLAFLDGGLLVQEYSTIPPEIIDPADHEEATNTYYENVELVDGENGEFIVEHEDEELYRFRINEDDLLEEEDGTTYMTSSTTGEPVDNNSDE